jgi:hypothetical protein
LEKEGGREGGKEGRREGQYVANLSFEGGRMQVRKSEKQARNLISYSFLLSFHCFDREGEARRVTVRRQDAEGEPSYLEVSPALFQDGSVGLKAKE